MLVSNAITELNMRLNEVWKSQGMGEGQIKTYVNALVTGAIVGGTGARISQDTK